MEKGHKNDTAVPHTAKKLAQYQAQINNMEKWPECRFLGDLVSVDKTSK